jgi:XTP/dITP diphosphohydrolase
MKLFLATANAHKVKEFARLLAQAGLPVEVASAAEAGGMPEVDETEPDFTGNARLKAQALRAQVGPGAWVVADDSGLEVHALGGEPGVRSARYAGLGANDAANRARLLERMSHLGEAERQGRFVCVLFLLGPAGEEQVFAGHCDGQIVREQKGEGGFGYDPLFVAAGLSQTFAEVEPAVKDRFSHRGRALAGLVAWMSQRLSSGKD